VTREPGTDASAYDRGRPPGGQRQERRHAASIIGDSWGGHAAAIAVDFHVCAGRKNGVEVRRNNDNFFFIRTPQFPDDVAGLVDVRWQASFSQQLFDRRCALRFLKRRRRDFRDACLLVVDPRNIGREPIESRADPRVVGEP